jgi:hypothetical protein
MAYTHGAAKESASAVYKCRIDQELNIFNAKSEKDENWLTDKLTEHFIEIGCKNERTPKDIVPGLAKRVARNIVDDFKYIDWFKALESAILNHCEDFTIPRRIDVLNIINAGGYDGFYNYEEHDAFHAEGNGLGIFAKNVHHIKLLQKVIVKWRGEEGTMKFYSKKWEPIEKKSRQSVDKRREIPGFRIA